MSRGNILYQVYVGDSYTGECNKVYESTSEKKANDFLYDYLRKHENEVCKAYIEKKYSRNFDKRNYDYE